MYECFSQIQGKMSLLDCLLEMYDRCFFKQLIILLFNIPIEETMNQSYTANSVIKNINIIPTITKIPPIVFTIVNNKAYQVIRESSNQLRDSSEQNSMIQNQQRLSRFSPIQNEAQQIKQLVINPQEKKEFVKSMKSMKTFKTMKSISEKQIEDKQDSHHASDFKSQLQGFSSQQKESIHIQQSQKVSLFQNDNLVDNKQQLNEQPSNNEQVQSKQQEQTPSQQQAKKTLELNKAQKQKTKTILLSNVDANYDKILNQQVDQSFGEDQYLIVVSQVQTKRQVDIPQHSQQQQSQKNCWMGTIIDNFCQGLYQQTIEGFSGKQSLKQINIQHLQQQRIQKPKNQTRKLIQPIQEVYEFSDAKQHQTSIQSLKQQKQQVTQNKNQSQNQNHYLYQHADQKSSIFEFSIQEQSQQYQPNNQMKPDKQNIKISSWNKKNLMVDPESSHFSKKNTQQVKKIPMNNILRQRIAEKNAKFLNPVNKKLVPFSIPIRSPSKQSQLETIKYKRIKVGNRIQQEPNKKILMPKLQSVTQSVDITKKQNYKLQQAQNTQSNIIQNGRSKQKSYNIKKMKKNDKKIVKESPYGIIQFILYRIKGSKSTYKVRNARILLQEQLKNEEIKQLLNKSKLQEQSTRFRTLDFKNLVPKQRKLNQTCRNYKQSPSHLQNSSFFKPKLQLKKKTN